MPSERDYPGVYVQEIPSGVRPIPGAATNVTAFIGSAAAGPVETPATFSSLRQFESEFAGSDRSVLGMAVRSFFANGGTSAIVVRAAAADQGGVCAALRPLGRSGGFNLLCLPDLPTLPQPSYDVVARAAAELCLAQRALLLLDPPRTLAGAAEAAAWATGAAAALGEPLRRNVAAYWPELLVPAAARRGPPTRLGPGGAVAGLFARTDDTSGVWKAPAGLAASLKGAVGLAVQLTGSEIGIINAAGLNAIRELPQIGTAVWGARTLHGTDGGGDWRYVPVRRLALYLEESIDRGTEWALFHENGERLWADLRLHVASFLDTLWRQGAFAGRKAEEAWFVKCGADTTTQTDVEAGIVDIVVGFAPARPAEFVVLRIRKTIAGAR